MARKRFMVSVCASAVAMALAGPDASALGMGGLRIQSALNQPFVAEIDLLDVKPDELDTVKAQLAGAEEFQKVGSERYHFLTRLRFTPQISPRGDPVIRVTSREPIREPYVDFLVETLWPQGRLVRQYTVLLDPPATDGRAAPRIEPPAAPVRQAAAAAAPPAERVAPAPAPRQRVAAAPPPESAPPPGARSSAAAAGGYPKRFGPVRPGTGLWRLALRNRPKGASVAQTALALYRNNQSAFIDGDINRVIAGRVLTIPSSAELFALDEEAAERDFAAAIRGEKVARVPIAPAAPGGPAAGDSRLRIAGTASGEPGGPPQPPGAPERMEPDRMEEDLLLVQEASESARQEILHLRARIGELEAELSKVQQLLKLPNAELARIRSGIPAAEGPTGPETAGGEPVPGAPGPLAPDVERALRESGALGPEVADTPPERVPAEVVRPVSATGPQGEPQGDEEPLGTAPGESPTALEETQAGAAVPAADSAAPAVAAADTARGSPGVAAVQDRPGVSDRALAPPPAVADAGAQDSTWYDLLLPLAGVAAVTAVGIGGLAWARHRRRRAAEGEDRLDPEDSRELDGSEDARSGGALRAGLQDSNEVGAADSPSSAFVDISHPEAETDAADVISEADIYIAYGRYREAEDLLRQEVARSPNRLDLKFKLAEAYFGARNRPALTGVMNDLRAAEAERSHPEQWRRLLDMTSAQTEPTVEAAVLPPSGPTRPSRLAKAQAGADAGVGADSVGLGSQDVLSLDLGDSLRASEPLPHRSRRSEPQREPSVDLPSADILPPSYDSSAPGEPGEARSARKDAGGDILSAPRGGFALGGEEPLLFDEETLAGSFGIDRDSEPLGVAGRASRPAPVSAGPAGVAEFDFDIDDLRTATELDLSSFVDNGPPSAASSALADELSLPGAEPPTRARPVTLRSVTTTELPSRTETSLPGLVGGAGDTPSSDLLSSQWQMDSGLWDETATKLDLARAYVEMGDMESARGILDEVLGEGTEAQRGEANDLLRKIG